MKTIIKLNHDDVVTVKNGFLTIENNSELEMFVGDHDADKSVLSDNKENTTAANSDVKNYELSLDEGNKGSLETFVNASDLLNRIKKEIDNRVTRVEINKSPTND